MRPSDKRDLLDLLENFESYTLFYSEPSPNEMMTIPIKVVWKLISGLRELLWKEIINSKNSK
jgi:hypothetical protein